MNPTRAYRRNPPRNLATVSRRTAPLTVAAAAYGLLLAAAPVAAHASTLTPVINEFVFNHTSTDTMEFVEVFGDPSTDLSRYWVFEIEGDSSAPGAVDDGTHQVGTTDVNGFSLANFSNVWENGSVTAMLVLDPDPNSTVVGYDIDQDDDGSIDLNAFGANAVIVDDVAVFDDDSGDLVYSSVVLGPNFDGLSSFPPGGASRIPNGQDTDSADDWFRNNFNKAGFPNVDPELRNPGEAFNTPGAVNNVPEPGSVTLLLIGGILLGLSASRRVCRRA